MFDLQAYLLGLAAIAILALAAWIMGSLRRNVTVVDSFWPMFFLAATVTYATQVATPGPRAALVLGVVALWALRLAGHLTWRNHARPEDHRYQAIRRNHEPHFAWKSLYLVFGLQGVLAWVISLPLLAAIGGQQPLGMWDAAGVALWLTGMVFEGVGDLQLARFQARPENRDRVLDHGLWRYTRHPNYFGECCVWWGYYLMAGSAGGWWSIASPLLMTYLLYKVSGVALLERDIHERRPAYRDYIARTNAFLPGPPHRAT